MKVLSVVIMFVLGSIPLLSRAAEPDTLYVSTSQVVHLRFASELKFVNLGNGTVIAKVIDGSKDFVAVKAMETFDFCTTMSCLETNGRMHTFVVAYKEHLNVFEIDTRIFRTSPGHNDKDMDITDDSMAVSDSLQSDVIVFEDIVGMDKKIYHIGDRKYDITIMCDDIIVKDDVLYIVLSLKNDSVMSYELSNPRFAIESRKRTKRGLLYEKAVFARHSYNVGTTKPKYSSKMVFSFEKIALVKGQVMRIYLYEKRGARNFVITLSAQDINKARFLQ